MKTSKTLLKRVKITRRGKALARQSGQNHFRAKARRAKQLNQKKLVVFALKNKTLRRYLSSG
ncbi:MAG: hypothetical protein HYT47_02155 [Candidatus Vogelbacteria bacterium]|nr:hypothetical protein [Candidatus Vogelbacteria bacterium]